LVVGLTFTREELMLLALMSSNNRAAVALARTHPAGYDGFIDLMNQKAAELGMSNTHYVDPSGIFNGNVSTAEDLVKLLQAVRSRPMIGRFSTETSFTKERQVVTKVKTRVQNKKTKKLEVRTVEQTRTVANHYGTTNRLLLTDDWNIHLQKTGFIRAAGFCMTMIINIDKEDYAIVLLNSPNLKVRALDAVKAKYWVEYRVIPSRKTLTTLDPYKRHNVR
jgi:D-alanyl-D-alanine endopeptidase (penicillin-binding protein 7)